MPPPKCIACGQAPPVKVLMCQRCFEWFARFSAETGRLPEDKELPQFMDHGKK